jgi:hypothetical protein
MDSVGHSGMHAPQAMHSSVIFMVMVRSSWVLPVDKNKPRSEERQMTNVHRFD